MTYEEDPGVFITGMGWRFKQAADQLILDCPLCRKEKHFYVNRFTGLWDCKKCGESGNLYQLKARLGMREIRHAVEPKEFHQEPVSPAYIAKRVAALQEDKEVMGYLTDERKYTAEIITRVQLGVERLSGVRWISFPWQRDGQCWGIKFRAFPPDMKGSDKRRFRRHPDCKSILYNVDSLKEGATTILASGETDAVALMSMGYQCVVSTTTGESAMPDDCIAELKQKDKVFVLYDSDETGRKSAVKIARRIGFERAYIVQLPQGMKDANDFLKARKESAKAELDGIIKRTKRLDVHSVHVVADVVDRLCEQWARPSSKTVSDITPWRAVNEKIEDITGLVVLSAPQGTGKTTWGLNIANHWALNHRKPTLFYCLEMTPEELVTKIMAAKYERTLAELKNRDSWYTGEAMKDYHDVPFYIGSSYRLRGPSEILELLRMAIVRYELQLVIFDNVHVIGRKSDRRQEIGQFTLGLKDMATEFDVPIIAIAQPRKLERGQIMTAWDLKDSVDLFSDADQVVILHRQQMAAEKDTEIFEDQPAATLYSPFTLVRLAKSRFSGPQDALIYLDGPHHRFRDLEPGEMVEFKGGRGQTKMADWGVPKQ